MDEKPTGTWQATAGVWLLVLILTAATGIVFNRLIPDAPLTGISLAFVAFFWFLLVFGVRWILRRRAPKEAGK